MAAYTSKGTTKMLEQERLHIDRCRDAAIKVSLGFTVYGFTVYGLGCAAGGYGLRFRF